ncbi:MAG: hypothetical protein OXC42_09075 [Gammaproteobacteria bacterium]|nr:hypothetical protein [Gammaproteobacteria bacterium]
MNPKYLAKLALSRLPKPYTDEVILHVFCEIERTPHLRRAYDGLMVGKDGYKHGGLNIQISQRVSDTLNAQHSEERILVEDVCEIVRSVTRLDDFDSNWSWTDEE